MREASGVRKTGSKLGGGHYKKKQSSMVKAVQIMHSEQEHLSECVKNKCVHETLATARVSKSMRTKP